MPNKDWFVIIMAGGRGERFWPASRQAAPKQLLTLLDRKSFLQQTLERIRPLVPMQNVFVITNDAQAAAVRRQLPKVPKSNVVAEPCGRDTCAAVALGAALAGARSTRAVMAVLAADHVIPETAKFQRVLADGLDLAGRGQVMVTIGIRPTEPHTGYGYIQVGQPLPPPQGVRRYRTTFAKVERFVEKPTLERAVDYLSRGDYRWNSGMFVWSFVTITEALKKQQPELARACRRWFDAAGAAAKLKRVLARDYPGLKKISVDYALMEHAQNVVVADGTFAWDDLGNWTSLARHLKADSAGNCALAEFIHVDAARNIIVDMRTRHRTPIAAVGLRDTVVVQTDDAVLVAAKSEVQKLKELVAKLADSKRFRKLI